MGLPLAPVELLERARAGQQPDADALGRFARAWLDGAVPDAQMAAWALSPGAEEVAADSLGALTEALLGSGDRLRLDRLAPTATLTGAGAVGDPAIVLAMFMVAALNVRVAGVVERGVGHVGGGADLLAAIPGLRLQIELGAYVDGLRDVGMAVLGPDGRLAPGSGALASLRHVTGAGGQPLLMAASLAARGLAAGGGVLAVVASAGPGAHVMADADAADQVLAVMELARSWDRRPTGLVMAADEPCGGAVGPILEVRAIADVLLGEGAADLREAAAQIAGLTVAAVLDRPSQECERLALAAVEDGRVLAAAERWTEAQGGDPIAWSGGGPDPAPFMAEVEAPEDGVVARIAMDEIGRAVRRAGAGRLHASQVIDPGVGLVVLAPHGGAVVAGQPLLRVHARQPGAAGEMAEDLAVAITVGPGPIDLTPRLRWRGDDA